MAKKSNRAAQQAQITAAQQRLAELKAKQNKREARTRIVLWGTVTVVIAGVLGGVAVAIAHDSNKKPSAIVQATPESVDDTSGIEGVKAWKVETPGSGNTGTSGAIQPTHIGTRKVTYFAYPPVGGPHNLEWLNCGEYASTPNWERAVHNLEHGAIIITYRPDLAADQIASLKKLIRDEPTATITTSGKTADLKEKYLDLWPFADQPSPIVLSSWGHQLEISTASDPRIAAFIKAFRVVPGVTPEPGAGCGGRSAPNPEPGTS